MIGLKKLQTLQPPHKNRFHYEHWIRFRCNQVKLKWSARYKVSCVSVLCGRQHTPHNYKAYFTIMLANKCRTVDNLPGKKFLQQGVKFYSLFSISVIHLTLFNASYRKPKRRRLFTSIFIIVYCFCKTVRHFFYLLFYFHYLFASI